MILGYDGSYEGLLTCLYKAVPSDKEISIMKTGKLEETLFEYSDIKTNPSRAELTSKAILNISYGLPWTIYCAFLSEKENIENEILCFLKVAKRIGTDPSHILVNEHIKAVVMAARFVKGEAHRFLGLIRFRKAGENLYISDIKPDSNILTLIAPHFIKRYPNMNVIIRDQKRGEGLILSSNRWLIQKLEEEQLRTFETQDAFEAYWKTYFQAIGIKERRNLKLQQHFVPKKYRDYLIEMTQ